MHTEPIRKIFSPWGKSDSGTGYPERLCSLCAFRFFKTQLNEAQNNLVRSRGGPCAEQEIGLEIYW